MTTRDRVFLLVLKHGSYSWISPLTSPSDNPLKMFFVLLEIQELDFFYWDVKQQTLACDN